MGLKGTGKWKIGEPIEDRFHRKYIKNAATGCWIWNGTLAGRPLYGRFWTGTRHIRAHRYSYEHFVGPITLGMLVCHKCDVPLCVNPDHLFLGTQTDNMRDKFRKGRANIKFGVEASTAKLTEKDVLEIREIYASGTKRSYPDVGRKYGVHWSTIRYIVLRITWPHI